jgi:hypothetical protein
MGSKPPARESLNTGSHSRKRTGEDESASGLSLDDSVDVTDPTAKRVRIDAEARESGSAKHDEAAGSRAQVCYWLRCRQPVTSRWRHKAHL